MLDSKAHHETHLEAYIVQKLAAQGWLVGNKNGYNKEYALFPKDLLGWLQDTQPQVWEKLIKNYGDHAQETLMKRLAAELEKQGTVRILRHGFSLAGCGTLSMSESAPEDLRNEGTLARYAAHRLRVVAQLEYHPAHKYAIDLVFFINGIPVATVEIKTDFTQSVQAAMEQYKTDRLSYDAKSKRKEPLLTFGRGAVVHFALSDSEI